MEEASGGVLGAGAITSPEAMPGSMTVAVQDDGNRPGGWASCGAFVGGSHGSPGLE